MRFYFAFVCCLTSAGIIAADILNLSNQLLEIQDDVITITKAMSQGEKLASVRSKLNATQESFDVLSSKLSEKSSSSDECDDSVIALLENHLSVVKAQMADLRVRYKIFEEKQLVAETVKDIKDHRFALAQEKLEEIKILPKVVRVVEDLFANSSKSFELLTEFTENLTDPELVLYFVQAMRREISLNETADVPFKWMRLAKVTQAGLINKENVDPETKTSSHAILNELYESIRIFTLNALEDSTGGFERNGNLDNLTAAVFDFDPEYSETIIEQYVHSVFGKKYTDEPLLYTIESHRFIRQRIKGLSVLYWRLQSAFKSESNIIIQIASALYKIQTDSEFKTLSRSMQTTFKNIVDSLPTCARNLFFLPSVCLWNKANEQYLTAGNSTYKNDSLRRNIFSTDDPLPGSRWKVEQNGEQFLFSSHLYPNEYLYAADYKYNFNLRYVFSWIPGNNTERQSNWFIDLWYNDYCFIKNGYHYENLISTNFKKLEEPEKDLNYAFIWVPRSSIAGNEFQWQIREC